MLPAIQIDPRSDTPLYRQVYGSIRQAIASGTLGAGERIPATRELAGMLGLNRTTVSAAYELLEAEGLIHGHVGRGSFVRGPAEAPPAGLDWERLLPAGEPRPFPAPPAAAISFASSRPAEDLFPVDDFRSACDEVLSAPRARSVLQLGSPLGYAPLREYLLEEARSAGLARPGDDLIVTNGCQQGLDLLARVLVRPGDVVAIEDPVYPGVRDLFRRAGAELAPMPVNWAGPLPARTRLVVATPTFQNPTGHTLPLERRTALARAARACGAVLVENDIYGDLRYYGEPVPTLKQLEATGDTVLLRSFSKIAFPGLRVGWALAPRALVARLAEAKQLADLHTDQLSQAVVLRFAQSGRLAAHRARIVAAGAERLGAALATCERTLAGLGADFTRPEGGMNLWVRLPRPLDAGDLLPRAHDAGIAYLPGRYFEVSRRDPGALRLSFAALPPGAIRAGIEVLGGIVSAELERARAARRDPAPALV